MKEQQELAMVHFEEAKLCELSRTIKLSNALQQMCSLLAGGRRRHDLQTAPSAAPGPRLATRPQRPPPHSRG